MLQFKVLDKAFTILFAYFCHCTIGYDLYSFMLLLRTSKNTFLKVFKQSQNIAKPKELWQTSKSLGLPNKKEFSFECLKNKNSLLFDSMSTVETSKTYYS